jgi:hypothetical protein
MGRKGKSNRQLYMGAATAAGTQRRADVGCAGIGVMLGNGNGVTVGSVMRAKIAVRAWEACQHGKQQGDDITADFHATKVGVKLMQQVFKKTFFDKKGL